MDLERAINLFGWLLFTADHDHPAPLHAADCDISECADIEASQPERVKHLQANLVFGEALLVRAKADT